MLLAKKRQGCSAPRTSCRNSSVSRGPTGRRSTPATPGTTFPRYDSIRCLKSGDRVARLDSTLAALLAVPLQQLAGVGRLEISNHVGTEVVEPCARQRVVDRPESVDTRHVDEVQAVGCGRGRRGHGAPDYPPALDPVVVMFVAAGLKQRSDAAAKHPALLSLHVVSAPRLGSHPERVVTLRVLQVELQANPEMRRMAAGPPAHLVDSAPVSQRVIDREPQ